MGYQDDNLFQDEMRYLRSTSVPAPYISVTPDASPNVFEEPESNMKSMPPRYLSYLLPVESVFWWQKDFKLEENVLEVLLYIHPFILGRRSCQFCRKTCMNQIRSLMAEAD